MTEIISPLSSDITSLNPHPDQHSKTIINLSEFKLEERHRKLLEKGLSYSPTGSMNEFEVYKDITLFLRKVYLRQLHQRPTQDEDENLPTKSQDDEDLDILTSLLMESKDDDQSISTPSSPLKRDANLLIKSTKMPPFRKNRWLGVFLDLVQDDLTKVNWQRGRKDNLDPEQRRALRELKEAPNLVIKKSDKGGNVVLLSTEYYENEIKRQLNDRSTYEKLPANPFTSIINELNFKLMFAQEAGLFSSRNEYEYLKVKEFNIPTIYIIPKVHKSLTNPPGRPIVSAVKGPLEKIGRYLDALLKEMVFELPSYIRDTLDVLAKIEEVTVSPGTLLVGIDVESLYTSIPHAWGLAAVAHFLDQKFPRMGPQNEFILEMLQFALTNNCFEFLGVYYRQIQGTSMGAPWAPSYACLHLGYWEEEVVYCSESYLDHAKLWLRFIDDVLLLWQGSVESLEGFLSELNENSRNIRLTFTYDLNEISFLDLLIRIDGDHLSTKTFLKATAANTLLEATSHHPKSLVRGIPTGQFLRIRRNCSLDQDYQAESKQLYKRFRERGYPHRSLKNSRKRASAIHRKELLIPKNDQDANKSLSDQVKIITTFGTQWEDVRTILTKHWHVLTRAPQMASIVGPKPFMVARRAKNLTDELVRSEYTRPNPRNWLTDLPPLRGMYACGKCHICRFVDRSDSFTDATGRKVYQIKHFINCNTTRVLYMLECSCHKLYIGKTKRPLKVRIGEHLSSIQSPDDDTPIGEHFSKYHNRETNGLKIKGFYALKLPVRRGDFDLILLQKEKECIFRLGTLAPNGLNTELNLQVFLTP